MICHAQFLLVKFSIKNQNIAKMYFAACSGICFQINFFFVHFSRLPIWPRFVPSFHAGKFWQVINGTIDINGDKFIRDDEIATKRFTYPANADWLMIRQNQIFFGRIKVANEVTINVIDLHACSPFTPPGKTNYSKKSSVNLHSKPSAFFKYSWKFVKCENWLHTYNVAKYVYLNATAKYVILLAHERKNVIHSANVCSNQWVIVRTFVDIPQIHSYNLYSARVFESS